MAKNIPFNRPFVSGHENKYILDSIGKGDLTGDGYYSHLVVKQLGDITSAKSILLTPSATHGLEMAALAINIEKGDEVIMSSFTFVSCGNAFVLRGAKIVFVDIRRDTMNIDEHLIEAAITEKTKAIVVMHYGSVACAMDEIMEIAFRRNLYVIEDAAHCIGAYYKRKHLGTIGHFGVISFHSTKNIHCGEGGALLVNDDRFVERLEIIREKGTNRQQLLDGKIDKYSWVDIGSSYLMSELNAAYLYGQLIDLDEVTRNRVAIWKMYHKLLEGLEGVEGMFVPSYSQHNGHIFYVKVSTSKERDELISFLRLKGIESVFHYVPLHTSIAGEQFGVFVGHDKYTTMESERLLRLPIFFGLEDVNVVCNELKLFFENK